MFMMEWWMWNIWNVAEIFGAAGFETVYIRYCTDILNMYKYVYGV